MPQLSKNNRGNIFSMTLVLLFAFSAIALSYIKIIQVKSKENRLKLTQTRLFYGARAGIEDALYELKQGNTWSSMDLSYWTQDTSQNDTFYKDYTTSHSGFTYPITISVTLTEPSSNIYNVQSTATITDSIHNQTYKKTLSSSITKAFTDIFYITESND